MSYDLLLSLLTYFDVKIISNLASWDAALQASRHDF